MEWIKEIFKAASGIKTFLSFSAFTIAAILILVLQAPTIAVTAAGIAIIILMVVMSLTVGIFEMWMQHLKRQEKIYSDNQTEKLTLQKEHNQLFQNMVQEITKMNQSQTFIYEDIKELKDDSKKIVSIVEHADNNTSNCWINSKKPKRNSN